MEQQVPQIALQSGIRPEFSQAINSLWSVVQQHAQAFATLREHHKELNNKLISAGKDQQVKDKEYVQLQQEHKTLSDRVKALERSLQQSVGLQQSYDELSAELQSVKRNAGKYDSELALRQEQIAILEEKLTLSEAMQKSLKRAVAVLLKNVLKQEEFPETDVDIDIASDLLLKEFRQRLIDSENSLDEVKELKKEIAYLEEKVRDGVDFSSNDEVQKLNKEIEQLTIENRELLNSQAESKSDSMSNEWQKSLEDKQAEIKELQLHYELKLSDMEAVKQQLQQSEDLLEAEREQVRLLKDQVIALRDLNPESASRQSSLESSKDKLRQERDELRTSVKELRIELEEKDQLIDALKATKGDLFDEVSYNTILNENKALKTERELLADKLETLKERLDKALNN